jgi:hypothetical protein
MLGLASGAAVADPGCPDVHWIGAAGSGERDDDVTANAGMGRVVYQSYRDLQGLIQRDGRTITAEGVDYPATAVPASGDIGGWLGWVGSVDAGTAAVRDQYASFTQRCPSTKIVLAGYSQGAMAVHRNLHSLAESPNLTAVLLIADGDRMRDDTTINLGSATSVKDAGKGVAQEWPILAHATKSKLPSSIGSRTISVCDRGDAVCDALPDVPTSAAGVAVHTSYALASNSGQSWGAMLYKLLGSAPVAAPLTVAAG